MKKNIIIIGAVLAILSLMAFSVFKGKEPETNRLKTPITEKTMTVVKPIEKAENKVFTDFIYDIGPRFSGITKEEVDKAKSIIDFLPSDLTQRIVTYESVSITIFKDEQLSDIRETSNNGVLNATQLKLLQSSDYSTSFVVRADFIEKNAEAHILNHNYASPHLTIVPENQAKYLDGKQSLINYLRENSKESIANIAADKLRSAKLYFTVTKEGNINNVRLDRTSGYPKVDEKMIELIKKAPGKWIPAENSKGDKVDQELVVSFGLIGC